MNKDIEEIIKPLIRNCTNDTSIFNTLDYLRYEDAFNLLKDQQQKIEQLEKENTKLKERVKELEDEIKSKWVGYCQKETLKGERCKSMCSKVQCGF